jgi:acyl-coenzyme A thioesterase PaaI-like protein
MHFFAIIKPKVHAFIRFSASSRFYSLTAALPLGNAVSTMDFTVKMLGLSHGTHLRATGRVLQLGKSTCVGAADVFIVNNNEPIICGTVLATGRRLDVAKLRQKT